MAKVRNGRVRPGTPPVSRTLTFSFKHLDLDHHKFRTSQCTPQFWDSLLSALKYFSARTVEDFCDVNHSEHRHLIDFHETSEPSGFGVGSADEDDIWQQPWQFALEPERHTPPDSLWRVHGIIINETFYLIWLDPDHHLYQVSHSV